MTDLPDDEQHGDRPPRAIPLLVAALCLVLFLCCFGWLIGQAAQSADFRNRDGICMPVVSGIYVAACALFIAFILTPWRARKALPDQHPVCAHCFHPHLESVHFCPTCSRPLTSFAATAGWEYVYAQAWCLGYGAHRPSRPLHVIGMVLLCGLTVLGAVGMVCLAFFRSDLWHAEHVGVAVGQFALLLVNGFIYFMLLFLCLRNWRRFRRDPEALRPASTYGVAPWWTYDRDWVLIEDDAEVQGTAEADDTV